MWLRGLGCVTLFLGVPVLGFPDLIGLRCMFAVGVRIAFSLVLFGLCFDLLLQVVIWMLLCVELRDCLVVVL